MWHIQSLVPFNSLSSQLFLWQSLKGQAFLTSAFLSLCYKSECMCLSVLDLQCSPCSQRALCCAVSLTCKEIPSDRLVQTPHMVTSCRLKLSSALWLPIGLQHKTVFPDANRWISIIRSPLLRSREGMQGPKKHINDKTQVALKG